MDLKEFEEKKDLIKMGLLDSSGNPWTEATITRSNNPDIKALLAAGKNIDYSNLHTSFKKEGGEREDDENEMD